MSEQILTRETLSDLPVDAAERQRRLRGKNLAVLGALLAFVAIVYVVAMVRMSGGTFP